MRLYSLVRGSCTPMLVGLSDAFGADWAGLCSNLKEETILNMGLKVAAHGPLLQVAQMELALPCVKSLPMKGLISLLLPEINRRLRRKSLKSKKRPPTRS